MTVLNYMTLSLHSYLALNTYIALTETDLS